MPSFYFEDLVFPEIDLCNLDACQNMFPDLTLRVPVLALPLIEIPPIQLPDVQVAVEGYGAINVVLPEIKIEPLQLPPIPFDLPQLSELNLLSLMMPELKLPSISLPQPKFYFTFHNIDIDYSGLALGLACAIIGCPEGAACLDVSAAFHFIPLVFGVDDFYFSWPAFPTIPDFCKPVSNFCLDAKKSMADVTKRTNDIENVINQTLKDKVQAKLDTLTQPIKNEIEKEINLRIDSLVRQKIIPALGELHSAKIENGVLKISPIVIPGEDITISDIDLSKIVYLPDKISIPWPNDLKKINLTKPLIYELPTITLKDLSYSKGFSVKLPGLKTFSAQFKSSLNYSSCVSQAPSGGNPCPTGQIQTNLGEIKNLQEEISNTSQNIMNILE